MEIQQRAQWEWLPREGRRGSRRRMCISLSAVGKMRICGVTMEAMGRPEAVFVFYDRANHRIGLKPAPSGSENSYPVSVASNGPGRVIYLVRLLVELGIELPGTVRFVRPVMENGMLVLDLTTAETRVSGKR